MDKDIHPKATTQKTAGVYNVSSPSYGLDVRKPYLYSSQHACSGDTKVQIRQHLRCRRLINVRRSFSREII